MLPKLLKRIKFFFTKGHFTKYSFYLKKSDSKITESLNLLGSLDGKYHLKKKFHLDFTFSDEAVITSNELFSVNGNKLPCLIKQDETDTEDWLNSHKYYPLYYNLFSACLKNQKLRMLEIGVRTGYMGAVFCKSLKGNMLYYGLDPNLYIKNGLDLASKSFGILKEEYPHAEFILHLGYSSAIETQATLKLNDKFDIIHIDGDHTLEGKLIDLKLARELIKPGGLILVDDYDNHNIVQQAVEISIRLEWFSKFSYVASFRGLAILQ